VTADGKSVTSIILTLKDSLNRPTPGKLVALLQGNGQSVHQGAGPEHDRHQRPDSVHRG
jgi:hypothetical protein